jgi:hypothetical protein
MGVLAEPSREAGWKLIASQPVPLPDLDRPVYLDP